jgi:hypothetical protein
MQKKTERRDDEMKSELSFGLLTMNRCLAEEEKVSMLRSQKPNRATTKDSTTSAGNKFQPVRLFGPLGLLVIVIHLSGCAPQLPLKPTVDHLQNISKIPLEVAIYYSPVFRAYELALASCLGPAAVLHLGPHSVSLFEKLFPMMFSSAVTLDRRSTLLANKTTPSLIIQPDIENLNCARLGRTLYGVTITYHFTLYSSSGEPLGIWNVTGRAESQWNTWWPATYAVGDAATLAMQDAAKRIAAEFRDIPAVQKSLQTKR